MLRKLVKKGADLRAAVREIQEQIAKGLIGGGGTTLAPVICFWDEVEEGFTKKFMRLKSYDSYGHLVPGDVVTQVGQVIAGALDFTTLQYVTNPVEEFYGAALIKNLKSTVVGAVEVEPGVVDITFSALPHPDFGVTSGANASGWRLMVPEYNGGVKTGRVNNLDVLAVNGNVVTVIAGADTVLAIQDDIWISGFVINTPYAGANALVFMCGTAAPRNIAS